jgi:hypothetical protein
MAIMRGGRRPWTKKGEEKCERQQDRRIAKIASLILSTLLSPFVINGQAKPQRLAFGEPDDRLHGARPGDDESGRRPWGA